jgi:hypothetical protein
MMFDDLNRTIHAMNPNHKIAKFSIKTATGSLRRHLMEDHIDVWVSRCDKSGVNIKTKSAQAALNEYRKGKGQSTGPAPQGWTPYLMEAFVDAIAQFIIGDDQVYFYIVLYSCIDEIL